MQQPASGPTGLCVVIPDQLSRTPPHARLHPFAGAGCRPGLRRRLLRHVLSMEHPQRACSYLQAAVPHIYAEYPRRPRPPYFRHEKGRFAVFAAIRH